MDTYFKFLITHKGKSTFLRILITLSMASLSKSEYGPPILSLGRPSTSPPVSTPSSMKDDVRYNREKTLLLEEYPYFATLLPMAESRSWIKSEELVELLQKDSLPSGFTPFHVIPPADHGIMVVIQELQIPASNTFNRSNLLVIDENGKILECFSKFVFQIEGRAPVEVCGRTGDLYQFGRSSVIDGVGPRSFVVPVGKSISVKFVYRDEEIDASPFLTKQVPFYDMGYLFRASIAFTAYKTCPHGPPFYDENNEGLWPCDLPQSNRETVGACIREGLFCDSIINCGMHDTKEFAVDERFCKDESKPDNDTDISVPHRKQSSLDITRLEEAIRNRFIRPFGYNDMIMLGVGGSTGKGSQHVTEPSDRSDVISHPAFVALIILITVICLLIIGLIFRYCCQPCVGKRDQIYGDSINPEAVARFHERTATSSTQQGRNFAISFDSLFKPVEDSPPSYVDLFPHEGHSSNGHLKVYHVHSSSSVESEQLDSAQVRTSERPVLSVYSIPVSLVAHSPDTTLPAYSQQRQFNEFHSVVHIDHQLPGSVEISAPQIRDSHEDCQSSSEPCSNT